MTNNMKSVVVCSDINGMPVWQKDYEAFMQTVGFQTKHCRPRHSFNKGKVERLVRFVKGNYLSDRFFSIFQTSTLRHWIGATNKIASNTEHWD